MLTFILILLLIAAIFGVLGAVLKVTLVIVLSIVLTIVVLAAFVYYWARHRMIRFQREYERQARDQQRRRGELPPGA